MKKVFVSGCSVVEALASAADDCWNAIMQRDLQAFAEAYLASFRAQVAMFPAMIQGCVQPAIDHWSSVPGVLAWKMPGAGGGGYLALVVTDAETFCREHPKAIGIHIRRRISED